MPCLKIDNVGLWWSNSSHTVPRCIFYTLFPFLPIALWLVWCRHSGRKGSQWHAVPTKQNVHIFTLHFRTSWIESSHRKRQAQEAPEPTQLIFFFRWYIKNAVCVPSFPTTLLELSGSCCSCTYTCHSYKCVGWKWIHISCDWLLIVKCQSQKLHHVTYQNMFGSHYWAPYFFTNIMLKSSHTFHVFILHVCIWTVFLLTCHWVFTGTLFEGHLYFSFTANAHKMTAIW